MEQQGVQSGQVSPDGQFVWDGIQWKPIMGSAWLPTDWTRPMQLAVGAFWALIGIYTILSPLLIGAAIRSAALKQVQQQSPNLTPDQVDQALNFALTVGFAIAVVLGILYLVLAVLSVVRRYSWVFYVDLVLLGLGIINVITGVLGLFNRDSPTPQFVSLLTIVISLVGFGLFLWMLVGRIQRGVWACRRTPVTA